jgi:hypothetical protein
LRAGYGIWLTDNEILCNVWFLYVPLLLGDQLLLLLPHKKKKIYAQS